jgi:restriction system protein
MTGPEFSRWINPVLRALNELGGSARPREVVERVARNERVGDDVLDQTNPAGGQRFPNQVHWARFYLAEGGLIDRSRHGVWKLTEVGLQVGQLSEAAITELVDRIQASSRGSSTEIVSIPSVSKQPSASLSPEVVVESVAEESDVLAPDTEDSDYRSKLLETLQTLPPGGFERLC